MKLSQIYEAKKGAKLQNALRFIYGHNGRPMGSTNSKMGASRGNLHRPDKAEPLDPGNRALGARSGDGGTPWKKRHQQFFRMSNDGATIRF